MMKLLFLLIITSTVLSCCVIAASTKEGGLITTGGSASSVSDTWVVTKWSDRELNYDLSVDTTNKVVCLTPKVGFNAPAKETFFVSFNGTNASFNVNFRNGKFCHDYSGFKPLVGDKIRVGTGTLIIEYQEEKRVQYKFSWGETNIYLRRADTGRTINNITVVVNGSKNKVVGVDELNTGNARYEYVLKTTAPFTTIDRIEQTTPPDASPVIKKAPVVYNYFNDANWKEYRHVYDFSDVCFSPVSNCEYDYNATEFHLQFTSGKVIDPILENVTACQTLTQPNTIYVLNASINYTSSANCITIAAKNVTFDCGNYYINISYISFSSAAIFVQQPNATIQNCRIFGRHNRNNGDGITATDADQLTIRNITIWGFDEGITTTYCDNKNISDLNITHTKIAFKSYYSQTILGVQPEHGIIKNIHAYNTANKCFEHASMVNDTVTDITCTNSTNEETTNYAFYITGNSATTYNNLTATREKGGWSTPFYFGGNNKNIKVTNIQAYSPLGRPASYGILIQSNINLTLHNLNLTGASVYGFIAQNSPQTVVINLTTRNATTGLYIQASPNSSINNVYVDRTSTTGIDIQTNDNSTFSNIRIANTTTYAVLVANSKNVTFWDSIIGNATKTSIALERTTKTCLNNQSSEGNGIDSCDDITDAGFCTGASCLSSECGGDDQPTGILCANITQESYCDDTSTRCDWAEAVCSGTYDCSALDGSTCGYSNGACEANQCSSSFSSCYDLTSSSACALVSGCVYDGCSGTVYDCSNMQSQSTCEAASCNWEYCSGTIYSCSTITDSSYCSAANGCSWDLCTGTVSDCTYFTAESACVAASCNWNGGSCDTGSISFDCNTFNGNMGDCGATSSQCTWNGGCSGSTSTSCPTWSGDSQTVCGYSSECTWTSATCEPGSTSFDCTNFNGNPTNCQNTNSQCSYSSGCGGSASSNDCGQFDSYETECGQTSSYCGWDDCAGSSGQSCDVLDETNCNGLSSYGCAWNTAYCAVNQGEPEYCYQLGGIACGNVGDGCTPVSWHCNGTYTQGGCGTYSSDQTYCEVVTEGKGLCQWNYWGNQTLDIYNCTYDNDNVTRNTFSHLQRYWNYGANVTDNTNTPLSGATVTVKNSSDTLNVSITNAQGITGTNLLLAYVNENGTIMWSQLSFTAEKTAHTSSTHYYNLTQNYVFDLFQLVQEGGGDTCTYGGSGDWVVSCSDNCTVSTPTSVANTLILNGAGIFVINAQLTVDDIIVQAGCNIYEKESTEVILRQKSLW